MRMDLEIPQINQLQLKVIHEEQDEAMEVSYHRPDKEEPQIISYPPAEILTFSPIRQMPPMSEPMAQLNQQPIMPPVPPPPQTNFVAHNLNPVMLTTSNASSHKTFDKAERELLSSEESMRPVQSYTPENVRVEYGEVFSHPLIKQEHSELRNQNALPQHNPFINELQRREQEREEEDIKINLNHPRETILSNNNPLSEATSHKSGFVDQFLEENKEYMDKDSESDDSEEDSEEDSEDSDLSSSGCSSAVEES